MADSSSRIFRSFSNSLTEPQDTLGALSSSVDTLDVHSRYLGSSPRLDINLHQQTSISPLYNLREAQKIPHSTLRMSDNPVLPEEWQTLCVLFTFRIFAFLADLVWEIGGYRSSPKIPEIKVWISMGGKVLTSHKKDTLDHTKVGAEIAGIEGREFEVSNHEFFNVK